MNHFTLLRKWRLVMSAILLLLLLTPELVLAQCGNVSSYVPTVSSTTVCSNSSANVYANGLPVVRWVYRDNNTGAWIGMSGTDVLNHFISVSTATLRTYRAVVQTSTCPTDTTAGVNVNLVPNTYGTNLSVKLNGSAASACIGSNFTVRYLNTGLIPVGWLYKDNGGSWNSLSTGSNEYTQNINNSTGSTITREFRALVRANNSCQIDTTDAYLLTIPSSVNGVNNNLTILSSSPSAVCAGTAVLMQIDANNNQVGNWIYQDNGSSSWVNFNSGSNNVGDYNTSVSTTTNRTYKVLVRNSTCGFDTSSSMSVTLNPVIRRSVSTPFPLTTQTSVCAGSSTSFSVPGVSVDRWIYRDSANANWITSFSGSNANFSTSSSILMPLTRTVRVIINNVSNNCSYDTSAAATVLIRPNTRGNTLSHIPTTPSAEVCAGNQVRAYMQVNEASNWLYRDNQTGNWINTFNSGLNYTDNNTNVTVNTQRSYRVLINSTVNCSIDTTPAVSIMLRVPQPGGTIAVTPVINQAAYCAGNSIFGSINMPSTQTVIGWVFRDNNTGTWTPLSSTGSSFNDFNTSISGTALRAYKAIIRNNETFRIDTSLEAATTINARVNGNIAVSHTITTGTNACSGSGVTGNIILPAGYTVQNWLYRDASSTFWSSYGFSNTTATDNSTTTTTNKQRLYRVLLFNSSLCRYDSTNILTVNINAKTNGTNSSILPTTSQTTICGGQSSISMSVSIPSGTSVQRWIFSDNNSAWAPVSGSSSSTSYNESSNNTRVLVPVTRRYAVINDNVFSCTIDTSAALSVSLSPFIGGGVVAITPSISVGTVCANNTFNANFSYSGTVQKWIYRDNNSAWTEFPNTTGSSSLSATAPSTNSIINRTLKAIVIRQGTCIVDTTQTANIQVRPWTLGNLPNILPIPNTTSVCAGNTASLSAPAVNNASAFKWVFRDNNQGAWTDFVNSTQTSFLSDQATETTSPLSRAYRIIYFNANGCSYDTSADASILINPRTQGFANQVSPTSNSTTYCSGSNIGMFVNGSLPGGTSVAKWLFSDNGGAWKVIPNTTSTSITHSNTLVSVPTNRTYKIVLNNTTTCSFDTTAAFTIAINPNSNGYAVNVNPTTSNTAVCQGSPTPFLSASVSSPYSVVRWIFRDNSGNWSQFPFSTNSTSLNDNTANTSTNVVRDYAILLSNSSTCSVDTSNTVSVLLNTRNYGLVNASLNTNRTNYCFGKTVSISTSLPSGYNGITQWIYSDNGGAWKIINNTSTSISDNNTYVSVNTSRVYRALYTNNTSCRIDTGNALTVFINATGSSVNAGTIQPTASPNSICSGSSTSLNVSPSVGNSVYRWIFSDNGNAGPWFDMNNSYNIASLSHQNTFVNTATNRLYKAVITDTTGCDFDSTLSVSVNINPIGRGLDTSIVTTGPDTVCTGAAVSLSIPSGSYNITKWQYRDNGGDWKDITSTSRFLTDNNTSVTPGTIRTYRVVLFNTSKCSNDTTSKWKNVVIKSKTYGNSLTQASISVDTLCSGSSIFMSVSGTVEAWMFKDGANGNWNLIPSSATNSLNHTTNVNTPVWRYYRALLSTNSCQGDSSRMDSVFVKFITYGNSAVTPTGPSSICAGSSYNVSVSLPSGGAVSSWIYRTNGGIWQVYSNTTSTSISDFNTNVSTPTVREFRVVMLRNCSYDTTNAISIAINPFTNGNDNTKTPTVASNSICTGSAVSNITLSGSTMVSWIYRNGTGPWQVLINGNNNNLTDFNTFVGSTTTRTYRAIVLNNTNCRYDTSAGVNVTINPVVLGNSNRVPILTPTSVCTGSTFTHNMNVGGDSSVIRWFYNVNGGPWTDKGSMTQTPNSTQTENNTYFTSTTSMGYRALIYKSSTCNIDTTQAAYATVNPRTYGNDNGITPNVSSSVCTGTNFNVSVTAGTGNSVQGWLYRDNGTGNWLPIYNASTSINQTLFTSTAMIRTFRALIVKGSTCTIDTTAPATITINPFTYGNDNAIVPLVNNTNMCSGGVLSISITPGGGNSIVDWLKRDNYTGNWNSMGLTTSNISDLNTVVSSPVNRTYRALVRKGSTCTIDTSAQDTSLISPRINGNDNGITPTTSNTNVCTGTAVTVNVVPGSGNTVQRWLISTNGSGYSTFSVTSSTSITDYNTTVSATTTKKYRAIITKGNFCTHDTTAELTVTISPRVYSNDNSLVPTTNNTVICAGGSAVININPGSNNVERWIYRENNGAWQLFTSSGLLSIVDANSNVMTTTIRNYRALVRKTGGCTIDTSASVAITFNPNGNGNQASVIPQASKTSICVGNSVTLSVSGFTGTSVTGWLYRDQSNASWNVVNQPATSFADFNTNLSSSVNRTYRAIINNSNNCSYDTTGSVSVAINTIVNGNAPVAVVATSSNICSGTPANLSITPGANYTVQGWLIRINGGSWSIFSNTTSTSITDFSTTVSSASNREYRALLRSVASCGLDTSALASVNINPIGSGSSTITPFTNTPTLCAGSSAHVSVSGLANNVVKWLYRDTVVDGWSSISSTSVTLFHSNTFVSYGRTRVYRAIFFNSTNCSNDTTAGVSVDLVPNLAGNTTSITPTTTTPVLCSGNPLAATATGFINGGTVKGWLYRDNNGAWTPISGTANANLNHTNTTVTVFTTRQYRALVTTGCNTDTTIALTVTIDVAPAKPSISNPSGTDSLICSETATAYVWRKDGVIISGANSKVYVATSSGSYQVEVANASDCKTLSDAFVFNKVGLTESQLNATLKLYPNPTNDGNIIIELSNSNVERVRVIVIDLLGKQIMNADEQLQQGQLNLSLGAHHAGVYFVTIQAEGATVTKRLVYTK